MSTPPFVSLSRFTALTLVSCVLAASPALAQEKQPAPDSARLEKQDEPLHLNPFVVTTSGDIGYLAKNTVAGSRLNTKLSDLAAPTTAFTQEFMEDIASTSIADLALYMPSTEIAVTESATAASGGENAYADNPGIRIRGLPAVTPSINFFQTTLRIDHFNTERVEQSRGPNSILFGLGSPGGVVNVTTKRAHLNQNTGSVTIQGRSHEGTRAVLDYNQSLLPDRLAVRVAVVQDDKNTWRQHEYDDQQRLFVAAKWQIAPKTELNAEWEHGLVNKNYIRSYVADDGYTLWANAGKNLSAVANTALGIRSLGAVSRITYDTATGTVMDWKAKTASVNRTIETVQAALTDFTILPKDVNIYGLGYPQKTNYSRGSVFITHAFTPHLNVELAGNYSDVVRDVLTPGQMNILSVDTNATLPTGQPNPNAGRAYVEGFPVLQNTLNRDRSVRLSLAYEKDLGHIFGLHQLALLGEQDWSDANKTQLHALVQPASGAPFNTTPENGANILYYRTYVDLNAPSSDITAADWRMFDVSNLTEKVSGRAVSATRFFNYTPAGSAINRFELRSAMAVLQSHFFSDRLITVAGFRKDWQDAWYSPTGVRSAPFGGFILGEYIPHAGTTNTPNTANNRTFSAVLHLTKIVGLTYNHASNSALPNPTAALPTDTGRAPNPHGLSDDIGFKVDLGKRAYLNVLYFKTSAEHDFSAVGVALSPHQYFNPIWVALGAANIAAPNGQPSANQQVQVNGYTFDSTSSGYEVELVANPTDNWRVFLNYSDSSVKRTNLGPEMRAYINQYHDFWLQGNNARVLLDGSGGLAPVADDGDTVIETVGEAVKVIDQRVDSLLNVPDGEKPRGQMQRKFNLRTNYSVNQGVLRGASVGGGARYQSGEVTNYLITANADGSTSRSVLRGKENALFDFNVGYRSQVKWLGHKVRWSLQLNVNNVFDETKILPMRVSTTGELINYRLQSPREFILTSKFDF